MKKLINVNSHKIKYKDNYKETKCDGCSCYQFLLYC